MLFVNKTVKTIKTIYLKNRSDNNKLEYNKQRNYCLPLLQKTKNKCYANLNEKALTGNKQFWRTIRPSLSDKIKSSEKIRLIEQRETLDTDGNNDNKIVNDDVKLLKFLTDFFLMLLKT